MAQQSNPSQDTTESLKQELNVKGSQLADTFKEIVEEGNARRVIIQKEGRTLMEFPLAVGVGGAAAAVMISPMLAAIGAVGAMMSDVKVIVERAPSGSGAGSSGTTPPPSPS